MINLQVITVYKELAQIAIDRAITVTEDLHKTVDNFVFDVQHHADKSLLDVQTLALLRQQRISKCYQFVRDINRKLGMALTEFLGTLNHSDNIKYLTQSR